MGYIEMGFGTRFETSFGVQDSLVSHYSVCKWLSQQQLVFALLWFVASRVDGCGIPLYSFREVKCPHGYSKT